MDKVGIEVAKDIVVIIASSIGAGIGLSGLKAWKKQLNGTTKYQLAKRYLTGVYRLRDAIETARSSFKTAEEIIINTANETEFKDAFLTRWKKVEEASLSLKVDLFEVEETFGRKERRLGEMLLEKAAYIFVVFKIQEEDGKKDKKQIISASVRGHDDFSREIEANVAAIEVVLRKYFK